MGNIFKAIVALVLTTLPLASCNATSGDKSAEQQQSKQSIMEGKRVLVAFFSRADENYGVGNIKIGNTQKVAELIAAKTDGTTFHIETIRPYASDYKTCIDEAKREKESGARPEIKGDIDVEAYDIIFLGYPNWWGDCPMAVYTFIEKHDWKGKTVVPFCTHEGSGLSGTESNIRKACAGATVLKGLALRGTTAQNDEKTAQEAVNKWIDKL